jgi:hypothetical protein
MGQISSFTYQGTEYQIEKVIELEPENGNRCIKVTTKDNKQFKLVFNEAVFKWVVTESI